MHVQCHCEGASTAHSLPAFPVYSSAFVSPTELVLGGGVGQSRSGIKNKLVSLPREHSFFLYL